MALREEWARAGGWLFRWRSYLPLAALALVLLHVQIQRHAGHAADPGAAWKLLCIAVSALGLAVRVLTVAHAPSGTSGRNTRAQQADRLNTTGMYSIVRHPLYVGNCLMSLGVVLLVRDWRLTAILALAYWLYYERIMFAEEEFLRERYGNAFLSWAERTPAFLPDARRWRAPEEPFDAKRVLRREYSGFFGAVAAFTAIEVAGDFATHGRFVPDPPWMIGFGIGLLVYLVLRTLKRRTKILA